MKGTEMGLVSYIVAVVCLFALAAPTSSIAQGAASSLSGEWTSDCLSIGKNDRHGYVTRIDIVGKDVKATSQLYASNSCQTPNVQVNFTGQLVQGRVDGDHIKIELVVGSITTTPNIADVVSHYNKDTADNAGCGMKGWEENVPTSVAGETCGPFAFAAEGTHLFDSAWVEGNKLRFGAFPTIWTNTSADKAPSEPSPAVYYRTGR